MTESAPVRTFCSALVVLCAAAVLSAPAPAEAQTAAAETETRAPAGAAEIRLSFAPLVRQAAPSVVNIYTAKAVSRRRGPPSLFDDPFFRRFFGGAFGPRAGPGREGPEIRKQHLLGSGVIVSADGFAVTNHHVIEGAREIKAVLNDRREFDARIILTDARTDLAVLRLETRGARLTPMPLGDSDAIEVGDLVLAIGNPFGVGQTVTSGIVSGLARTVAGVSDLNSFIQTDAAVNPGNSGGALVSIDGRLIGVNTAIFSRSGGSHGIGFAVPSNMVRQVIDAAAAGRPVTRPWLGAGGQAVTSDLAGALGLEKPSGVLISSVYPGGPAAAAGVRAGDVVTAVNGREIPDPDALKFRIAAARIGETARLTVRRGGGAFTAALLLQGPPEDPPRSLTVLEGGHPLGGAQAANLNPALAEEMQLDMRRPGVVITDVPRRSAAARFGVRRGDVVISVNGREVDSVRALRRALAPGAGRWRFILGRGGRTVKIAVGR